MIKKFYEQGKRSLVKSVTFRIVVLLSDMTVIFLITRRYDLTLDVVLFTNLGSTLLYFFHERIWNKIYWGRTEIVNNIL